MKSHISSYAEYEYLKTTFSFNLYMLFIVNLNL